MERGGKSGFAQRYSSAGAWCQQLPASPIGSHIFQSSRAGVKITFNHWQHRAVGVICFRIMMRILWFDFVSHSFSGLDWISSFGTLWTLFDELQKSGHVNKAKMWLWIWHILSLQILIFLSGTLYFSSFELNCICRKSNTSAGPPASLRYCTTFCSWRKTVSAFVNSPLSSQIPHLSTLRSDRCINGAAQQLHQPPADLLCLLCANKATSGTYCHVK